MKPTVICLTPVKNEAWILDRFLRCAGLWADHILVADQASDDESREIARRYPKVIRIDNPSPGYDEAGRQRLLIEHARRIPGKRLLLALDADEMLTANWMESPEWASILQAREGTVLRFQWVNLCPDLATCWIPPEPIPFGFVDDGSEHHGERIHSRRLPTPTGAPSLLLREIKVLHYQFTDWERMKSKQRWYQCWDILHNPKFRPLIAHRLYHHMDAVPPEQKRSLRKGWLAGYERSGIDMTSTYQGNECRYERATIELFEKYGLAKFRKLDIWDVDWTEIYTQVRGQPPPVPLSDPRGLSEKLVHAWLRRTHKEPLTLATRVIQRALRPFGW